MSPAIVQAIPIAELCDSVSAMQPDANARPYTSSPSFYLAVATALRTTPLPLRVSDEAGRSSIVLGRLSRETQRIRVGYLSIRLPSLLTYTIIYKGIIGSCHPEVIAHALPVWLRSEHGAEQIVFAKLPADSEFTQIVKRHRHATALAAECHWRLQLPETFEALLARHSSKHRQRLRWERRKLEETLNRPLEHVVLGSPDQVETILAACEAIGSRTYHAKVGGMVRQDPVWRTMLESLASLGCLACHQFRIGGDPIAFVLAAHHERVTHIIAMAHLAEHSRYSPGKHLLLEVIRDSCERGMHWVDYGFGDAQYKQIYGSHCEQEVTLLLTSPTLRATMVRNAAATATSVHHTVQRLAGTKIAGRAKRLWRAHAAHRTTGPHPEGVNGE